MNRYIDGVHIQGCIVAARCLWWDVCCIHIKNSGLYVEMSAEAYICLHARADTTTGTATDVVAVDLVFIKVKIAADFRRETYLCRGAGCNDTKGN